MEGVCPACGRMIVARLQALGRQRTGQPRPGDMTVCACRELLVVQLVSPIIGIEGDWQVVFRQATKADRATLTPEERRVMDEAKLIHDTFPRDRRLYRGH